MVMKTPSILSGLQKELKYPLKLEKLYKSIVKGSSIKKINFHYASEDTKALLNIFKTNDFKIGF